MGNQMDSEFSKIYGSRLRIRVCGLCWDGDRLLLVNHKTLSNANFWAPPGGGIEFGESLEVALKREFREETGLEIDGLRFAFGTEFIRDPLHAIELFFSVKRTGGDLIRGYDPELQIIQDVKFISEAERGKISPDELHGIFQIAGTPNGLSALSGFYTI